MHRCCNGQNLLTCHQYHVHIFWCEIYAVVFNGVQPISQHWHPVYMTRFYVVSSLYSMYRNLALVMELVMVNK